MSAPQITTLSLCESVAERNNRPGKELIIARTIYMLSIRGLDISGTRLAPHWKCVKAYGRQ